jgi:hypothetical protein
MRPLADWQYDRTRPTQTKRGAAQALRVGQDKVDGLIKAGLLKTVDSLGDRTTRVTTESILKLVSGEPVQG